MQHEKPISIGSFTFRKSNATKVSITAVESMGNWKSVWEICLSDNLFVVDCKIIWIKDKALE